MSKVAAIAKLTAAPGKRDELLNAFKPLLDAVHDEPGTLIYALHASAADETTVYFYELYEDDEALKAHSGSAAMKAIGGSLAGLVAAAPEITKLDIAMAKGLPL